MAKTGQGRLMGKGFAILLAWGVTVHHSGKQEHEPFGGTSHSKCSLKM